VLDDSFQRFPGQIEAVEFGVAVLERGDHAQGLRIVIEAAMGLQTIIQRPLAGMAEWGMAKVVGERERFGEILIEPELAG
jgi:hypothetical protein